jgi:inorganic pyrophosphatase
MVNFLNFFVDVEDIEDVEKVIPGKLKEVYEFLRDYKIPDGKPPNQFAFEGKPKNKKYAVEVIISTHKAWENLLKKESTPLSVYFFF